MPAPRRAILANIHEQNLDPKKAYSKLSKDGKLVEVLDFSKEEKKKDKKESKTDSTVFGSLNVENSFLKKEEKLVEETSQSLEEDSNKDLENSFKETEEPKQEKLDTIQSFAKKKNKKKDQLNQN